MAAPIANKLRLAYAASLHHLDACIGVVLKTLSSLPVADHTITVFTADHGFALGDHGVFGKHHMFDAAVHVPLLLRLPLGRGHTLSGGGYSESVDLFPTLALLAAGVRLRSCKGEDDDDGACTMGAPLVEEAAAGLEVHTKEAAFFQQPQLLTGVHKPSPCVVHGRCTMGYSVAAREHRLTEWVPVRRESTGSMTKWVGEWTKAVASELYDGAERQNIAGKAEAVDVERSLRARLREA